MERFHFLQCIAVFFLITCLVSSPAMSKPPEGKGKSGKAWKHNHRKDHDSDDGLDLLLKVSISFGEARRLAVSNGYIGYSPLPPGIRKNLLRGKPLPPGIAKKIVPGPLLKQLPAYPGYKWHICGSDLVLVAIDTAVVADVLFGVFK